MANRSSGAMVPPAAMAGGTESIGNVVEGVPVPSFEWMGLSAEWGTRVRPGEHGLRLSDLNVGIYGEVPEEWNDQTRRPRGALPRPGVPPLPYNLRHKHQLWADSAADLYEEAIQRRWVPATDVPWHTLKPLPEDVERAVCQVCTELSQYANTEIEIITYWQDQMSYGYFEVKQFLATVTFDCCRQIEAMRKRALANGGGLGMESRGLVNRMILESRGGWTESVVYQYLLRGTYTMRVLIGLLNAAHNDAERFLYARCIEDQARHLTYGYDHVKYAVAHQQGEADVVQTLLMLGEAMMAVELEESAMRPALAIIFGGGVEGGRSAGMQTYRRLVGDFVGDYLAVTDWIGVQRGETLNPMLKKYVAEASPATDAVRAPSNALSIGWLEEAQRATNADPAFRKRGSVDVNMGVRVGEATYLVSFAAFNCQRVRELASNDTRDADFVIDMAPDLWQRFLAGRRSGNGRSLIELDLDEAIVRATNPRKKLDFLRYHTSLQAFFDAGAKAAPIPG